MLDYANKPEGYFANCREEVAPLLPKHSRRALEVGCGMGSTLRWLKESRRCDTAVGLEFVETAAAAALKHADEVLVGNAEVLVDKAFKGRTFDLVLCLDVLEHMVDPWSFVTKVAALLEPGGTLITSVPNVRHLSVVLPLLFGRWRYASEGVLDRAHLRFFTRESALALAVCGGLTLDRWFRRIPPVPSKSGLVNLLSLGLLKDFCTLQYIISSRK